MFYSVGLDQPEGGYTGLVGLAGSANIYKDRCFLVYRLYINITIWVPITTSRISVYHHHNEYTVALQYLVLV